MKLVLLVRALIKNDGPFGRNKRAMIEDPALAVDANSLSAGCEDLGRRRFLVSITALAASFNHKPHRSGGPERQHQATGRQRYKEASLPLP
jgi:hypothetical protein